MIAKFNISETYINIGNKQDRDLHVLSSNLGPQAQRTVIQFIKNSVSKYSNYSDISYDINNQCIEQFGGTWTTIVGEINKLNSTTNCEHAFSASIGPYKIIITCSQ